MDLVTFLSARLDDDEHLALAASPGPWHENAEGDEVLAVDEINVADGFALSGRQLRATVSHIARHDPVRVLAEVEAKRRLISEVFIYESTIDESSCLHRAVEIRAGQCRETDVNLIKALRLLAEPYASHPDYAPEWSLTAAAG